MHRRSLLTGVLALAGGAGARAATPRLEPSVSPRLAFEAYARWLESAIDRTGGGRFAAESEAAFYAAHDEVRRQYGLQRLARHPGLARAARAHAGDQTLRRYFAHVSPEGFSSVERVGLMARTFVGLCGENIADETGRWLGADPQRLMDGWMTSPGHRQNILRGDYDRVGMGVVQLRDRTVAVAVFGQAFAELAEPMPLAASAEAVAKGLAAARPAIYGYDLSPVGGHGERAEGFGRDRPPAALPAGPYTLRPRLQAGRMSTVVYGPVVELNGFE